MPPNMGNRWVYASSKSLHLRDPAGSVTVTDDGWEVRRGRVHKDFTRALVVERASEFNELSDFSAAFDLVHLWVAAVSDLYDIQFRRYGVWRLFVAVRRRYNIAPDPDLFRIAIPGRHAPMEGTRCQTNNTPNC